MLKLLSLAGLVLTIAPSLVYAFGIISLPAAKWTTLAGTILWFAMAPQWVGRKPAVDATAVEV